MEGINLLCSSFLWRLKVFVWHFGHLDIGNNDVFSQIRIYFGCDISLILHYSEGRNPCRAPTVGHGFTLPCLGSSKCILTWAQVDRGSHHDISYDQALT